MNTTAGLFLAIIAYLVGLENGTSTHGGMLSCRIAGHRYAQGTPEQGTENVHMALYCIKCGRSLTITNRPKESA